MNLPKNTLSPANIAAYIGIVGQVAVLFQNVRQLAKDAGVSDADLDALDLKLTAAIEARKSEK